MAAMNETGREIKNAKEVWSETKKEKMNLAQFEVPKGALGTRSDIVSKGVKIEKLNKDEKQCN